MNADGSDVQQLTDSPALDAVPAYSPNGASIVFSSDRSGRDTRRLFVMTTTGGNQTRLIGGIKPKEQMSADWQPVRGAKDPCTIRGTIKADQLVGTSKADVICGLGGGDTITGGAGRDVLLGGSGNDVLHARDSQVDRVDGGPGTDTAFLDRKLDKVVSVERRRG